MKIRNQNSVTFWIIQLVFSLVWGGCSENTEGKQTRNQLVREDMVSVLFDPTIFPGEANDFSNFLHEFKHSFYLNFNETFILNIRTVGLLKTGAPLDFSRRFSRGTGVGNEVQFRELLEQNWSEIEEIMRTSWRETQADTKKAQSCLLSGLYQVSEDAQGRDAIKLRDTLVIISDFLEACNEMGYYNFENKIVPFRPLKPEFSLSNFERVICLQIKHAKTSLPMATSSLRKVWRDCLSMCGIDENSVSFQRDFAILTKSH